MSHFELFIFLVAIVCILSLFFVKRERQTVVPLEKNTTQFIDDESMVQGRAILSKYEVPLFFQLMNAFPEYIVLTQVSFNALIKCNDIGLRNRYNRKMVDFVLSDHLLNPIAVIELDDRSHKSKEADDAFRDELLNEANIPVLRYNETPSIKQLKADLRPIFRFHNCKQ